MCYIDKRNVLRSSMGLCNFGVHDHNFMKCDHQMACRGTKPLTFSNDLHMTSNNVELLFSSALIFGQKYCPLMIGK